MTALPGTTYDDGHLRIDFASRRVTLDGKTLAISGKEFDLLEELVLHEGAIIRHRELLEHVWGPEYVSDISLVYVAVASLRSKIEPDPKRPQYILTVPRFGYLFQRPTPPEPDYSI